MGTDTAHSWRLKWLFFFATLVLIVAAYWPGLSGGFLFDDFPNIVDNDYVHMEQLTRAELVRAALSSPSSEFKRPLASISFSLNHLLTGLNPFWMKLTNLVIHLLNGVLVFLFSRQLFLASAITRVQRAETLSLLVAVCWLVLPINLSAVLYVVQRMESLANLFVLLGLIGYASGRMRMLAKRRGLMICYVSLIIPTTLGLLAKETAITLPLYAFLVELLVFRWSARDGKDARIITLFVIMLAIPLVSGLAWILPQLLLSPTWAFRDFTLSERLMSEARVVCSYIAWTLIPRPEWLAFHHDDFPISKGLLQPWSTLAAIASLTCLVGITAIIRKRMPIVALGLALFLGGHVLTATILPLELVYEHRNYFSSFGLVLVVVSLLAAQRSEPFAFPRQVTLALLSIVWITHTAMSAHAWGHPLRLATELAIRNPDSPRAQYELGHAYIVASGYRQESPFIPLAQGHFAAAAVLPSSSILPEQALIIVNERLGLPVEKKWWTSLKGKLIEKTPSIEDVTALVSLSRCVNEGACSPPQEEMVGAFIAALTHPHPNPLLLSNYATYAENILHDPDLALTLATEAVDAAPTEPAHLITLIQILAARGEDEEASSALNRLHLLNLSGRIDLEILALEELLAASDNKQN